MVLEVVDLRVDVAQRDAFEAAVQAGLETVIAHAKGYLGHEIKRSQESAGRYLLLIKWQTLEHHTVDFRGSEAFTRWRAIVGPFFAAAPVVEHFDDVVREG